jgi:putative aldouronate transport system substrate-binding protein
MKKIGLMMSVFLMIGSAVFAGAGRDQKASLPSSSKPAEITVELFDAGTASGRTDGANNNWTKWIQEKLLKDENVSVKFVLVPRSEEITMLNNLMASGTAPDICFTYSYETITNFGNLGGLVDMAPYVDTLLVDLKKFLGPDQALPGRDFIRRQQDPETGKLYMIPAKRIVTAQRNIFMRKDWLDKLGLPPPATPQQYFDALAAFKEKDPGSIGTNNVLPYSMTEDVRWEGANIIESFIDPKLSPKDYWINNVVQRNLLQPGYKEGVRFMNKMYNAGLIDKDFPLYKSSEPLVSNIIRGAVGSFSTEWDQPWRTDWLALLRENVPGADIIAVDPMTSSDGITHKTAYDAAGIFFFIPASSRNPEAAMRYMNWLSRFENYNFLQIGPEGIVHDMVDGVPHLKAVTGPWIQNSTANFYYTIHINGLDLGDTDVNIKALAYRYQYPPEVILNAYNTALKNAKPEPVVPVTLTAAAPVAQTLQDKAKVLLVNAITCSPGDFDRIWDAGIADWLASGAQAVRDERAQKYYVP